MDIRKAIVISGVLLVIGGAVFADETDRVSDRGDRVEQRLDKKGDRIDRKLDRKGRKIDRRMDRRSDHRRKSRG